MNISPKRLAQFAMLYKSKTGVTLESQEALAYAETLLHTTSLLYKPVDKTTYCDALVSKLVLKTKKV